uniref:Ribbon-helix-helix protein CopG domain-containing protein n=1 Tax=Solibacter usitatus (strain Ellin6076) TaxID=234267 RepID=Q01UZ3_SOLUE
MRRTQLYLDEALWSALHARAKSEKTTISQLVREAVRELYMGKIEERKEAMQAFVGIRKGVRTKEDAVETVRKLRRGSSF